MRRLSIVTAVIPWSSRTSSTSGSCKLSGASVSAPGTGSSTWGALSATSLIGRRTVSAVSGAPPAVASDRRYSPEAGGTKLPLNRPPAVVRAAVRRSEIQAALASGAVASPRVSSRVPAGSSSVSPPVGTGSASSPR